MTVIKSVSLSDEHAEYCKREGVSLSAVLRAALDRHHAYKTGELLEDNASLNAKIGRLMDNLQKLYKFIEKNGLSDAWFNELTTPTQ